MGEVGDVAVTKTVKCLNAAFPFQWGKCHSQQEPFQFTDGGGGVLEG